MESDVNAIAAGIADAAREQLDQAGVAFAGTGVPEVAAELSRRMSDQVGLLAEGVGPLWMSVAVLSIAGLLYCFLGYRALKFVIGFTGFLLAGMVAGVLMALFTGGQALPVAVATIVGGVSGCMAVYFLYRAGLFLIGSAGAGILATKLLEGRPESWVPWAILGCALLGGLVALLLERPAMVFVLAAAGGLLLVEAAAMAVGAVDGSPFGGWVDDLPEQAGTSFRLAAWGLLTMVGITSQLSGRKRRESGKD